MSEFGDSLRELMGAHDDIRENYVRAPMGWAAGKSRSLESILPMLPYRYGFCDVFGGSGCVLAARRPSKLEVFNDRHSGVTCFYRCIRDVDLCRKLIDRLELTPHSREEFLWCKETWERETDLVERAARWFTLHQFSFLKQEKTFARTTKSYNVSEALISKKLEMFWPMHKRLKNVQIENQDWRAILKDYDSPDMVFYLDPPYIDYAKGKFKDEMGVEDHKNILSQVFDTKGFVAVSGMDCSLYRKMPWDDIRSWEVYYSCAGMAFHDSNNLAGKENDINRTKFKECLYIKEADE